jgi:mRNA interferase MazF
MSIRRGEVYFTELGPTVGREQSGRRPVVVVSNDTINAKPLVILVVPGTRAIKAPVSSPANVFVPQGEANLPQDTVFLAFQAKAIDASRIKSPPVGTLSAQSMEKLSQALAWSLDIS